MISCRCWPFLLAVFCAVAPTALAREDRVTFEGNVKPILTRRCSKCHTGDRPRGELDLTSLSGVLAGGVSGKVVLAGKPEASPLYTLTAHLDDPKMPPGASKIPQSEIDILRKWIEDGLIERAGNSAKQPRTRSPQPVEIDGLGTPALLARRTPITALAASPVAPHLAVPGNKQVLVYDLSTGKLRGGLAFPEGEVHVLRFSRDGELLLAAGGVGGESGALVAFETKTWKRQFTLLDPGEAILAADISADRTHVAFGGPNRVVKIAAVPEGKILQTFRKPTDWVLSLGFSPDGLLLAAGDRFGGVFVWESRSGKEFLTLRGHTRGVTGIAWRADSDALATSSEDRTVRIWDMHTGTETTRWDAHTDGVLNIAWPTQGNLATAGRDGFVRLWEASGKRVAEFGPTGDGILQIVFSNDGKRIYSADWAGVIRNWPLAGGSPLTLSLPVESKPVQRELIPVPTPKLATPAQAATVPFPATPPLVRGTLADLERKKAALRAVEDAAEKFKEEAARNPGNPALARRYLQLCKAALTMKAEIIATEGVDRGGK